MARFYGVIGYFEEDVEVSPGVIKSRMIERTHSGDILKESQSSTTTDEVNPGIRINHYISILANDQIIGQTHAMRYIVCYGQKWDIASVEIQSPRVLIRMGGLYRGTTD